jgi:hypothetical protein
MLLLTEMMLFYWNLLHEFTSNIKKISAVSDWAQHVNTKLESGFKKPLHLESASSLSHPTGSALSRVTHTTTNTTTTATAPSATPEGSVFDDDVEAEEHTPDEADGPEHLVAYTLANMSKIAHNQKLMVAKFLHSFKFLKY